MTQTIELAVRIQLATRSRKGENLIVTGTLDDEIHTVRGSDGSNSYTVDLNKGTCTCPDYVYRMSKIAGGKCKHILRAEAAPQPMKGPRKPSELGSEIDRLERLAQEELAKRYGVE